jgi:hypothetical protein
LSLALASVVHAEEPGFMQRLRGQVELALSGRADVYSSLFVVSGVASADFKFSHGFGMGADWAFFLATEASASAASAQGKGQGLLAVGPGDPWLKVWHEGALGPSTHLGVAVGMTIPAAWLPRDATRRSLMRDAYALGAATRGLWNAWLWAPQQIALAATAQVLHELSPSWRVGAEAGLAGSYTLGRFTNDLGALYGQLAPLIELHGSLLTAGVRMQAVVTDARPDPLQLSAAAYVRFEQPQWQLQAAGLCNLDSPLGVIAPGLSICGALLSVGVSP